MEAQFKYSNYEPTGNLCIINVIDIKDPSRFVASFGELKHFKNFQNLQTRLDEWSRTQQHENSQNPQNRSYFLKQHVLMDATNEQNINRSWCRAQIESIETNHLNLRLIDQGIFKKCSWDQVLLQLPDFYFSIEPQAKLCRLLNAKPLQQSVQIETVPDYWTQTGIAYFKNLMNDDNLSVTSIQRIGDEYVIDVRNTVADKSVLTMLQHEGHAALNEWHPIKSPEPLVKVPLSSGSPNQTISRGRGVLRSMHLFEKNNTSSDMSLIEKENPVQSGMDVLSESRLDDNNGPEELIYLSDEDHVAEVIKTSQCTQSSIRIDKLKASPSTSKKAKQTDIPSLMSFFEDDYGQKKSHIKIPEYRCSDETILSGYRPNVDVDFNRITQQIKMVNKGSFVHGFEESDGAPCFVPNRNEDLVYEIVNNNELFNTRSKKVDALVNLYKRNPKNSPLIVELVIKEILSRHIKVDDALEILSNLRYCSSALFNDCLHQNYTSIQFNDASLYRAVSCHEEFCKMLGILYKKAFGHDKFRILRYLPKYCSKLVTETWLVVDRLEVMYSIHMLKCVEDFLRSCFDELRANDVELFKTIYKKADGIVLDNSYDPRVMRASYNICRVYLQNYIDKDLNEHTFRVGITEKDTFNVNYSTNEQNLNYVQVEKKKDNSSNFIRSFMDADAY